MAKKTHKRLVLLDAHALIHRAYHALPDFANSKGEPTGALYGLITMIIKIIQDFEPDHIVACYDLPGKTFRHEAYKEYKGGRSKTDDALKMQLESSRGVCEAFNIPIYDAEGFEADDMLGTIVEQLHNEPVEIIIASGDMDTLQLVSNAGQVKVFTLKRGIKDTIVYDERAVRERFGFAPKLLPDYKGLRGDPSDNIIGIKGIGEKGACELISTLGSLESIFKAVKKNPNDLIEKGFSARLITLLQEGEDEALFSKVLATIRRDAPIQYVEPAQSWRDGLDMQKVEDIIAQYEFKSLLARIKNIFTPIEEAEETEENIKAKKEEASIPEEKVRELGIAVWLAHSDTTHPTLEDSYQYIGERDFEKAYTKIMQELREKQLETIYEKIEKPLIPIVQKMKDTGVLLDLEILKNLSREYHGELDRLEKKIFKQAGIEFNIRSPKQLGEILFERLQIQTKGIKKTPTGQYSTKESELEKMRGENLIIDEILSYRELDKLLSTYIDTLPLLVDEQSRLHSELLQDGTSTGRFASQNPNLQNIPIRSDMGKAIRNAFIAPTGSVLVVADYSQIELRLAAMMSGDTTMTQVFVDGGDIHNAVASRVFGVEQKNVTHEQRRTAKIINFGILYGMGVSALQKNLGSTRAEAQSFFDAYFEEFPSIRNYMDTTKAFALEHGYTETIFGRRRYFANLHSRLPYIRAMAERMAINAPIQGTEADCIKLAMQYVDEWIVREHLQEKVKMIMQIHDELVFEVHESVLDQVMPIISELMSSVLKRSWIQYATTIPLKVSLHTGKSWGEAK